MKHTKLKQGFGASLDRSTSADEDVWTVWYKRWNVIVSSSRRYYDLPGGAVGREFVDMLAEETSLLTRASIRSERLIVFLGLMLQRDNMVKKGKTYGNFSSAIWKHGKMNILMKCSLTLKDVLNISKRAPTQS